MDTKPTDIDGYLATVPDDARAALEELRRTIKATAPDAVESISYGLPTFKYGGRSLIYFGAAKNHCAVYGTSEGTIRFPPGEPLPEARVKALVSARIAEIDAAATGRTRKTGDGGKSA